MERAVVAPSVPAWSAIKTQAESLSSQMEHSDHQLYQGMLKQSWKGCAGDHIQDGMWSDQGSRLYEPKKVPLCVCLVLGCIGVSCWWHRHKNQDEAWHLEGWSRKTECSWPAETGLSDEIRLSHALSYFILCKIVCFRLCLGLRYSIWSKIWLCFECKLRDRMQDGSALWKTL